MPGRGSHTGNRAVSHPWGPPRARKYPQLLLRRLSYVLDHRGAGREDPVLDGVGASEVSGRHEPERLLAKPQTWAGGPAPVTGPGTADARLDTLGTCSPSCRNTTCGKK